VGVILTRVKINDLEVSVNYFTLI